MRFAPSFNVLSNATGTVLVTSAHLRRPVRFKLKEWSGGLSLPEPSAFSGSIELFSVVVARVNGLGQLAFVACFVNFFGLF